MKIHWQFLAAGAAVSLIAALAVRPAPARSVDPETSSTPPTALATSSLSLQTARQIVDETDSHRDLYQKFGDKSFSRETLSELVAESLTERKDSTLPLLHLLAEKDPRGALEQAISIPGMDDDLLARLGTVAMAAWAKFDPDAAFAWLEQNSSRFSDGAFATASMRGAIITSVARDDPEKATSLIHKMLQDETIFSTPTLPLPDEAWPKLLGDPNAHRLIPLWLQRSPAACLAWYRALPVSAQSDYRQYLTPQLILTSPDPSAEAARLWEATDSRGWSTAAPIADALRGIDPALAGEWIGIIADELRDTEVDILFKTYAADIAGHDPSTAFAWINAMEHDGFREPAAEELFSTWSRYQPLTAEREFLAAGWSAEWITERRRDLSLRELNNDLR
jgi:hypothetical protein